MDMLRVKDVRIFKSHDDHHKYVQGQFWVHVTDYKITDGITVSVKKSLLAPVVFGINPSDLRDGLSHLIFCLVVESKSFCDRTSLILAEKITAKIMSRFSFITTTSCSNLIIAVNLDKVLFESHLDHQTLEFDHEASSSSFNDNEEDMDDDDDDDDNEEDMDDDDDNEEDMDNDDDNDDDDEYKYEDCFSDIQGFREVTGLVDVKPQEVLSCTDCCSICLEEFGSDYSGVAKAESLVCSHMFHKDCIGPWLRQSNCCPLCRSVFIAQI